MANSAIPKDSGAPINAEYIVKTSNAVLTEEIALDTLPAGTITSDTIIMGQLDGLGGDLEGYSAQSIADLAGGSGHANEALSNLAAVAINTALIGDTDNTYDFGSDEFRWKNVYATGMYSALADADTLSLGAYDVDGAAFQNFIVFTSADTPTCVITAATISGGTMSTTSMNGNTATNFIHQTGSISTAVTCTTQTPLTNDTTLASTAYCDAAVAASPGGTVTSVSGTADRITSSGGATPVIDIAATYVGQNTITTLGTITTGVWNGTEIAVADGGTGATTAGGARTNLGLEIGTDVQAYDSGLNSIAGLTTVANNLIYTTASDTYAVIAPANSSLLVTSGAGVPSLSAAIPNGVTATTQAITDDDTSVATTGFVKQLVKIGQTDVACSSNTTFTQDIDTNHYFKLTFTSDCTLAFTFTSGLVQSMCVELIDAGAYTVTLPAGLEWAGGSAPTFTSSGRDIIVVWNNGDDLISAALIGQDFS